MNMNALSLLRNFITCGNRLGNFIGKRVLNHTLHKLSRSERFASSFNQGDYGTSTAVESQAPSILLLLVLDVINQIAQIISPLLILQKPLHPDKLAVHFEFGTFHTRCGSNSNGWFVWTSLLIDFCRFLLPLLDHCWRPTAPNCTKLSYVLAESATRDSNQSLLLSPLDGGEISRGPHRIHVLMRSQFRASRTTKIPSCEWVLTLSLLYHFFGHFFKIFRIRLKDYLTRSNSSDEFARWVRFIFIAAVISNLKLLIAVHWAHRAFLILLTVNRGNHNV